MRSKTTKVCSVCGRKIYALGFCVTHYQQVRKHGHTYKHKLEFNDVEFDGDVCKIVLQDQWGNYQDVVVIDKDDYDKVKNIRWNYAPHKDLKYAQGTLNRKCVKIHQLIMGTEEDKNVFVDHIDGNPLNNKKVNLRKCTRSQNLINQKGHSNRTSKYKGVTKRNDNKSERWRAHIGLNKKQYILGQYKTQEEAAIAYNDAAIRLHGEFARLNQI